MIDFDEFESSKFGNKSGKIQSYDVFQLFQLE